jgi:hypothetical protein
MAWVIGIDEAGYGPNLGPLVMTSVACRVPDGRDDADLWKLLREAVRRPEDPADGRLIVGDSKAVYTSGRGLGDLETGVLACSGLLEEAESPSLATHLARLGVEPSHELHNEAWFTGGLALPHAAEASAVRTSGRTLTSVCNDAAVCFGLVRQVIVAAPQFNRILDTWGTKGAVLGHGLAELLGKNRGLGGPGEQLAFFVDKHGGRNTYSAMLQDALPDGLVVARHESMARSSYDVLGLDRPVRLTFQPRADAEHFCVALASMASKYVRELLMHEFNAFWRRHLPDLAPTAGYPGDAARFYAAIRPAADRLGLPANSIWRRK